VAEAAARPVYQAHRGNGAMTVRDENMENQVYRFCYVVAEHILLAEAGIENRVVFKRLKRSRAFPMSHRIEFGYESIGRSWSGGCWEYSQTAARLALEKRRSKPGWEGVWCEVVHEVAHVIQYVADGKSDHHGKRFAEILHWVRMQYYMAKCMKIAGVTLADVPKGWKRPDDEGCGGEAGMPVEYTRDLEFIVKSRPKRQWWSWRMQPDRKTVNIAISTDVWNRLNPSDLMFLISYIKASVAQKLHGDRIGYEMQVRYARLKGLGMRSQ